MERIVAKFGGSSVADAQQIQKVRDIIFDDPRRKVIVVSAPGKRVATEAKLTDLLYLCHEMVAMDTNIDEPFGLIRKRFNAIVLDLRLDVSLLDEIDQFHDELYAGCTRDYAASRGEYFSAKIVAQFLGAEFIDPGKYIYIRGNGTIDPESYSILNNRLADTSKYYVIAGFYGSDNAGKIKTFSRGGSDISGAVAARAISAILYENWTDTSGILMADPRIVENPKPITEVSFREIREMSYMGASVFHDEAILPVREKNIPIQIKNTNSPSEPGTLITANLSAITLSSTEIAGITGRKDFSIICLEKTLMNREVGYVHRLLGIFHEFGINIEQNPASIDSVSVIVESGQLEGIEESLLEQIKKRLDPDTLSIEKNLALVAVVGEGMVNTVGIAGKIFSALAKAGINVRVINQGASELNVIIGISADDYEKAVRVLYDAFIVS